MKTNNMKYYKTNPYKSTAFYFAIFLPVLTILITALILIYYNKGDWIFLIFFYVFAIFLEIIAIKYRKTFVTIDEKGIQIKSSNLVYEAQWSDIIKLEDLSFTPSGESIYQLKTKDKKTLSFNGSLKNCDDLLKKIESYTGLKFK